MNPDRALELKVGIFVAIGLAMIGGFVLKFGRLGEGFKIYYDLTVRFKDASGLLKGSDVVLSGAKIGRVSGGPRLLSEGGGWPFRCGFTITLNSRKVANLRWEVQDCWAIDSSM